VGKQRTWKRSPAMRREQGSGGAEERGRRKGEDGRGSGGAEERPDLCSPARRGIIKLATDPPREELGDFKIWVISTRRAEK